MDIYLFGILAARTMLSDVMPSTIGKVGKCKSRKEAESLLQRIEEMKSSGEFLDTDRKIKRVRNNSGRIQGQTGACVPAYPPT
jgi:hypothetical protein